MNDDRKEKGRSQAKDASNQIYDTRMFSMLNESAQGLTGARGRRIAERDEIDK